MENPRVMVKVGSPGQKGTVEISDLLFTARGPTAGLVAMEWNLKAESKETASMWGTYCLDSGGEGDQESGKLTLFRFPHPNWRSRWDWSTSQRLSQT